MKKIIVTLAFFTMIVTGWSQARIPVNEPNTGNTNKPIIPTTTNTNNTATTGELKKYVDPQGRFSIGYPPEWKFEDKTESAIIQITSPSENDKDNFKQNINLQIEEFKNAMTIEEYVKANMDGVKDLVKGYREVSAMYFNRNGVKAYQIIYKGKYGDMTYEIQIKQLFAISNGKGFVLTYVSKEDERDAFETTANKIFNSFKNL